MAELREFYWRNSNFIFNVEVEVYVREVPLILDDLAFVHNELAMDVDNVFADVTSSGRNPADYGTIFGIWPCEGYTGTPPAGAVPWADWVRDGIAAVINLSSKRCVAIEDYLHEYHHALAHMFLEAGFSDFPLTHYDDYQTAGNTGGEGVYFEFLASTVGNYPKENWFDQSTWSWGDIRITADADNDGLPDYGQDGSGADLAITEASLSTSTLTADTDGDYLTDFEEATIHFLRGSDPVSNTDTDDDGFIDGEDMYPLYPHSIQYQVHLPSSMELLVPENTTWYRQ